MKKFYFVAEIATYYGVIGLGDTAENAVNVAALKAKEYLDQGNVFDRETGEQYTLQGIIDYFSPRVTKLEMNSATYEGGE